MVVNHKKLISLYSYTFTNTTMHTFEKGQKWTAQTQISTEKPHKQMYLADYAIFFIWKNGQVIFNSFLVWHNCYTGIFAYAILKQTLAKLLTSHLDRNVSFRLHSVGGITGVGSSTVCLYSNLFQSKSQSWSHSQLNVQFSWLKQEGIQPILVKLFLWFFDIETVVTEMYK